MVAEGHARYFATIDPPARSCPDWWYSGHIRPCRHVREPRQANETQANETIGAQQRRWKDAECGKPLRSYLKSWLTDGMEGYQPS